MPNRLHMPAAMPAEIAERLSDVPGNDIESFMEQAREQLVEKLSDGKRVGRCDLYDLIDCDLNSDRYRILLEELGMLLLGCEAKTRNEIAAGIRDGLIERYLDAHPDLVEDQAAELAAEHER